MEQAAELLEAPDTAQAAALTQRFVDSLKVRWCSRVLARTPLTPPQEVQTTLRAALANHAPPQPLQRHDVTLAALSLRALEED